MTENKNLIENRIGRRVSTHDLKLLTIIAVDQESEKNEDYLSHKNRAGLEIHYPIYQPIGGHRI